MAGRLVTIATFENSTQSQVAKNALEAEGISAVLGDQMTVDLFWNLSNAIGGVKVQVLEEDVERAVAVLEKELGPAEKIDEEELAAEAEAALPEEGAEPPPKTVPASGANPSGAPAPPDDIPPLSDRDWHARGLFFVAWFGLAVPPIAFVALYFFLNAAFGRGELSPRGRYNLFVGGVLTAIGMCIAGALCISVGGGFS